MNFGIIVFLIIFGFSFGFVIASWAVFMVVKNHATIIGGQLIDRKLKESVFIVFAARISKHDNIVYRVPEDMNEGSQALIRPKEWQKNHEREIIGKPTRIGILKIDGKLIPYLHYSFKKITPKEGTKDAFILEAFDDPKVGLAIEGVSNEINEIEDEKIREDAKSYLEFVKSSYDKLKEDLKDERTVRIVYQEQILPMAQKYAEKFLGIDTEKIANAMGIPTYEEIIQQINPDRPKPDKDDEKGGSEKPSSVSGSKHETKDPKTKVGET